MRMVQIDGDTDPALESRDLGRRASRAVRLDRLFADASSRIAKAAGRPATFVAAILIVLAWGASGPLLHFSDTWQLIMNTVSSIITFLMVFLIQNTQARDSEAMHAKLDTIIAALDGADNRYLRIERLPDSDIEEIRARFGPHPQKDPGE
jgi:low affinity Fe/Cu permease